MYLAVMGLLWRKKGGRNAPSGEGRQNADSVVSHPEDRPQR
jgi:hypothetical protein